MTEQPDAPPSRPWAVGRLHDALSTALTSDDAATRARAAARADRWRAVLDGMADGRLTPGSRTPVAGAPAWATPEVVTGGFATGRLLAEQPPDEAERARAGRLPPGPGSTLRERLNLWYLGDAGQAELLDALTEQRYRVDLPEHAALAVVALLVRAGRAEQALDVVSAIGPHLDRLRFTPHLTDHPVPVGADVHLEAVGEVASRLRAATPPAQVVAEREAVALWSPLLDDLVALWAETVVGDLPQLVTHDVTADGTEHVAGGWPAQRFPPGWEERRAAWLERWRTVEGLATASTRHRHPRSNLVRLRRALEAGGDGGAGLSGRDVGSVRRALASTVTRRGAPGSAALGALRAAQAPTTTRPTHAALAHLVAERLDRLPADGGITDLEPVLADAATGESASVGAGAPVPASVARKVVRALRAPVGELVERGVIGSGEVLAQVLPQVTAAHVGGGEDPVVAGLHARTYAAFRRRRSLLLVDLQHQVGSEELPWVAALSTLGGPRSPAAARQVLREVVLLTLGAFPHQVLPNPLVRELGALATAGELRLALVEEVAADIFTGTFTVKWRTAAQVASQSLGGSLYARYYDLPPASSWASAPQPRGARRLLPRWGPARAEDFAAACRARAVEAGRREGRGRWGVADNGAVLEQSQILTTHNLAVLGAGLGLGEALAERAPDLAERVMTWVLTTHARLPREHRASLTTVKNIAHAWRQGVYLLGLCDREQQDALAQRLLGATADGTARRLRPAAEGLAHVVGGDRFDAAGTSPGGGRRLLGWSVGPHWLLALRAPR